MKKFALRLGSGLAAVALVASGVTALTTGATAAVPDPVAGNITALPSAPRVVPGPGMALNAGQTVSIQIGGKTFGDVAVPANATGVIVNLTSKAPAAAGALRVWTTGAGEPGTGAVYFGKGEEATNITSVALDSAGKLNVSATAKTSFVMALTAYFTPVKAAPATVVKKIDASVKTLEKVGGSIRAGVTDFGKVSLTAGTWDARVIGGFTGLNNTNRECTAGDTFLTGTMVLFKGDAIAADFSNVLATTGGVVIPESASETLTQDPTLSASTFITLTETTDVHVGLFAYDSKSGTSCAGVLKGNIQSGVFKLN